MTEVTFGIVHIRDGVEVLPAAGAEMSVIGILATAPDADEDVFPLDEPVYFTTDDTTFTSKIGSTGTLKDAIEGIAAQLDDVQRSARVIVVRVDEENTVAATIANMIGSSVDKTGMHAFRKAPAKIGFSPRLIIAPGYTQQQLFGVTGHGSITGGTGGTNGTFALGFTGGTGTAATGTFTVAGGALTAINITSPGGYSVAPTAFSFAASTGLTGAASSIQTAKVANGVATALPAVCGPLKARAILDPPATDRQAFIDWRETLASDSLIAGPACNVKVTAADGSIVEKPSSPRIAGLAVKVDNESEGRPFRSWANRPILGIVGVSRDIDFSLVDGDTEGQDILSRNGSIIVRGESGVESSISDGGFYFVGTDTLSEDPLWRFYHVCRGRDWLELGQIKAEKPYLGVQNITLAVAMAIAETMRSQLGLAKARGEIIDYRVGFEPDKNTPEEIRLGNLQMMFKAEEPPVLRKLRISSRRYRPALENLVAAISSQINSLAA
ncbi:phage tail protein [Terrarubrum flagellatum]|uniref:phage tail protein n=1 Tax=Terrirubrum flagellatum TaxID=2895980 RepID=UPI0031455DF0